MVEHLCCCDSKGWADPHVTAERRDTLAAQIMQLATQLPVNLRALLSVLACPNGPCGQPLSRNDLCNLASPADLVKVVAAAAG